MPYPPSLVYRYGIRTRMLQYIPSQLTLLTYSTPWPILTSSVLDALTSLCTALASAVYTLCHLPINPMIIHILISISHSAVPNIV
ncbi:ALH_1b_G0044010.mRNA.1.CDS.1 [Saccharomyces cerevisiae]|nr:ALH_1b_G0044010.mRNA.1.CDS.1 [Saccharomyces cerevisiae]CAI6852751.1 ALH_1b_G0044010.mRNA.1.CDS.1 [Saccharomyces cerevisiae]